MKRILIPYDFSQYSRRALGLAMQGYPFGTEVEIELLHVIDESLYENVLSRSHIPNEGAIHSYLHADIEKVKADLFDPEAVKVVPILKIVRGRPADQILESQKVFKATAIMIGGQGHGGVKEMFLGRTAQQIAREAPSDVYVVKSTGVGRPPKRILCAVDFSDHSKRALEEANRLCVLTGSKLSIIMVVENPYLPYLQKLAVEIHDDEALKDLIASERQKLLAFEAQTLGANRADTHHAVFGPVVETITSHAEILHAGTIVVGPKGRGAMGRALLGSMTERIMVRSKVDVLVVK